MNAHTEITHDAASALAVFWRKGRKQFVPLTNAELDAAGLDVRSRVALQKSGLIAMSFAQQGGRVGVWEITEAGINALNAGVIEPLVKRTRAPSEARERVSFAAFAPILSALSSGPMSNAALASAVGREISTVSKSVSRMVVRGLASRQRAKPSGKMGGHWAHITITDAGREWLAQNGGAA